jgi:putative SOS response-associated peptidase YedK
MCALFSLRTTYADLISSLGLELENQRDLAKDESTIDERFLPHQLAPCVRMNNDKFYLEKMNFSLIPNWSKERRPKFATHNARIETLSSKPTWKRPLLKNHALVPISEFIEPIYEGEYGGNMIGFSHATDKIIWAAGLWDEWVDPGTGEIIPSFSIITHDPSEYVRTIGHDREPLFIANRHFDQWLKAPKADAPFWIDFLKTAHEEPSLKVRQDRALKSRKK